MSLNQAQNDIKTSALNSVAFGSILNCVSSVNPRRLQFAIALLQRAKVFFLVLNFPLESRKIRESVLRIWSTGLLITGSRFSPVLKTAFSPEAFGTLSKPVL